jgi:WD40 repeat protein
VSGAMCISVSYWGPRRAGLCMVCLSGLTGPLQCRRLLRNGHVRPQGVLPGHTEGVTYVSARGDGRYCISNSKDCTLRMWDVRKMRTGRAAKAAAEQVRCFQTLYLCMALWWRGVNCGRVRHVLPAIMCCEALVPGLSV